MTAPVRFCLLAMAVAVTACSSSSAPPPVAEGDEHIDCALAGASEFKNACAVERVQQGDVLYLTVRHPDGGFRRFEVLKDGHGLAVADGADEAKSVLDGGVLDVTVGTDRYRFPATRTDDARNP